MLTVVALCLMGFGPEEDAKAALVLASLKETPVAPKPPRVPDPPPVPKPAPAVIKIPPTITTRAPVGHTHTCANGHTWDHSMTAGHNCPICGLPQYVQDSRPRMVTVRTASVPRTVQPQYHDVMQMIQGGCPNGNCPNARR